MSVQRDNNMQHFIMSSFVAWNYAAVVSVPDPDYWWGTDYSQSQAHVGLMSLSIKIWQYIYQEKWCAAWYENI